MCGSFISDCEQSATEEHNYKGEARDYPTEFSKVIKVFESDQCASGDLYSIKAAASMLFCFRCPCDRGDCDCDHYLSVSERG